MFFHHSWNSWLSVCDTEGNKRIYILDNLSDSHQPHQHIPLKEKKKVSWYTNSKILFLNFWNSFPIIENVRIKSLTCFKHQINTIVVVFVLWKILPGNQFFERMKILIQLEEYLKKNTWHETCGLHKYMNDTVDKTKTTVIGHTN